MSRPDRWEALELMKPEGWGKPGSTDPIDLLMFAATGGSASVDDPILATLDAIEDELGTLASALGDNMAVHGYAGGRSRARALGEGRPALARALRREGRRPMKRPALNLADPAAVCAWLDDLSGRVDDLADAAEDQTAPIGTRTLDRAKARELIQDARGTLDQLVALTRGGLGADPDATPTEPGVTLDPDEPPWEAAPERVPWEEPATRRHLPPAERARKVLLVYFDMALPNGVRGEYAAEIRGLVDDIIAATIVKLRDDDHGDPAGLGDVGPAGAE